MLHQRRATPLVLVLGITMLLVAGTIAGEKKITRKELPSAVLSAFEKAYPKAVIRGLSYSFDGRGMPTV